jgi:hypothetical protein
MAIHGRLDGIDMNKKNNFPGAGTYEMQNRSSLAFSNAPRFSLGGEQRLKNPAEKE